MKLKSEGNDVSEVRTQQVYLQPGVLNTHSIRVNCLILSSLLQFALSLLLTTLHRDLSFDLTLSLMTILVLHLHHSPSSLPVSLIGPCTPCHVILWTLPSDPCVHSSTPSYAIIAPLACLSTPLTLCSH